MAGVIATIPKFQFSANGVPMVGGTLETYIAGSTTPATTWQDSALTIANTNPISLDARGECVLWLDSSVTYKLVLKNSAGVTMWTQDNIVGSGALAERLRTDLAASSGASLVGTLKSLAGAVASTLAVWINGQTPNARSDFAAPADGVLSAQAALLAGIGAVNATGMKQRCFVIPAGTYKVDQLVLNDLYDCHIQFQGVTFTGNAGVLRDSLLKLKNAYNVTLDGSLTIDCAGSAFYDNAVFISAEPGGTIAPSTGIVTRLRWDGLTVYNAKNALRIGSPAIDAQCSEITVNGFNPIKCPSALYIAGSQTGASFVGCNIMSEYNALMEAAPQWAIVMEGGFMTMSGGELGHMLNGTNGTVWMKPATSALYNNPYPILRLNGVHIETAAQLLILSNPLALATPDGGSSEFTVTGCSGYVSNTPDALPFIDVEDGSYTGSVSVKQSKFYKALGSAVRTGANINCYGAPTTVNVDRESFGRGFKNWMGGVSSGSFVHGSELIVLATSLNGAAYPTAATALKFTSKVTGDKFDRYNSAYNTATGIFTVPAGGLKTLCIAVRCSAPSLAGDIYIKQGGTIVAFGQIINTVAFVEVTLANLAAGDTVTVFLQPSVGVTFGIAASDNITFTASN